MLRIFQITFGLVLLAKAIDVAGRGASIFGLPLSLLLGGLWAVGGIAIAANYRPRIAASVILVLCFVVVLGSQMVMFNQHLYLIGSICLILVVNVSVPTLLKVMLTLVYGFGALTKLNESYLSGTELFLSMVQRPAWQAIAGIDPPPAFLMGLAAASICTEAFLAVAFWLPRARWVALIVGLGFHAIMMVAVAADPASFLRLAIFGLLMIVLYIPFFATEVEQLRAKFLARFRPTSVALAG